MRRAGVFVPLLLAGCGQATETAPAANVVAPVKVAVVSKPSTAPIARPICPEFVPKDDSDHGLHLDKPLPIEKPFKGIVSASKTVMTVQALSGDPVCVPLGWISEASGFELSIDKRFLQFDHRGYESFGHVVVDRASREVIETGEPPLFSRDGRYFAAAQASPSGFGGLEGIAIWEVSPNAVKLLGKVEAGVTEGEWTVDGFGPGPCVALSVRADDGTGATPAPLRRFSLVRQGGKWALGEASACPARE